MVTIIKKELRTYFTGVSGFIFLGFLILITAVFFSMTNIDALSSSYSYTLSLSSIAFFILIPTLTMRLFSEEARQKTDQLLYTSPISIWKIVIGKYFASFILFCAGMAATALFPVMLTFFGTVSGPETIGAFIGYILLGGSYIAVGLFISVLTDSQIASAVATFAVILVFYLMTPLKTSAPADPFSSLCFVIAAAAALGFFIYDSTKNLFAGVGLGLLGMITAVILYLLNPVMYDGVIAKFLGWFSVLNRFNGFIGGILVLSDIIYFITFSFAFIYLTINVIEKRRWR